MELDEIKRYQLIIGIVFGIFCILYLILVFAFNIESEVLKYRFENANDVFNGLVPDIEYPPFALLFFLPPRLFSADPFGYNIGYVVEVLIFFIIGLILTSKLAEKFGKDQKKAMLLYAVLMMLMFEFVVDRYDIFPVVLTLLSFYCFITKRYFWAMVILSIATMTKVYPALLFPIYLIPMIMEKKWIETIKMVVTFAVVSIVILVTAYLLNPEMISFFVDYHVDRPLHIESVAASLIYPFSMLGITDVWIEFGFGSDNLLGAWPDAVAPFLLPITAILILIAYVVYAYIFKRTDDCRRHAVCLGTAMLFVIVVFIVFGKVFSSQYLIWIIPLIIFLLMENITDTEKKKLLYLTIAAIVLTQVNFAYNIGYLGGGANINDLGMMVLLARNVIMLVFTYYVARIVYDRYFAKTRINEHQPSQSNE